LWRNGREEYVREALLSFRFSFETLVEGRDGKENAQLDNKMAVETNVWLETLGVVLVSYPVLSELDVLSRVRRGGRLLYFDDDGHLLKGEEMLYFLTRGNIQIFDRLEPLDVIAATDLRGSESLPGTAATDSYDCAIASLAITYDYRLITSDKRLQAEPRLKKGCVTKYIWGPKNMGVRPMRSCHVSLLRFY
jgi:hypothetical protein